MNESVGIGISSIIYTIKNACGYFLCHVSLCLKLPFNIYETTLWCPDVVQPYYGNLALYPIHIELCQYSVSTVSVRSGLVLMPKTNNITVPSQVNFGLRN